VAARAVAMYGTLPEEVRKPAIDELQELYYRTFGFWSIEDLEKGRIFRWVDNAVAMSRVEIAQTPQEWARAQLMSQFENLHFDNGPHSFTRVVLRYRLNAMARVRTRKCARARSGPSSSCRNRASSSRCAMRRGNRPSGERGLP